MSSWGIALAALVLASPSLFHTTAAGATTVNGGTYATDGVFPHVVTAIASREVIKTHGARWQLLKSETRAVEGLDSNSIDASLLSVSLLVDHQFQAEQLLNLYNQGELVTLGKDDELTDRHLPKKLRDLMVRRGSSKKKKNSNQNRDLQRDQNLNAGKDWISGFSECYPTVAQTYFTLNEWANDTYPEWVTVDIIGQSYLKTVGDPEGWDIPVAIIDVPSDIPTEDKAPFMIVAGHHSRELTPPLTVLRWVESLLESYGKDPDVTWMLNRTIIHLVPIANPDGRVVVQNNMDWMYRKNAEPNACRRDESLWGTDLNRNYPMFWGDDSGSSGDPCSSAYRGQSALSAPESAAVFEYAGNVFADEYKKGTAEEAENRLEEACDEEAAGIFFDVHASGDFVYYSWGFENVWPPNNSSILSMSSKLASFGNYKLWGPGSSDFLYTVSGDATDATYGQHCINSYGYELGTQFYETCEDWEALVKPIAFKSFMYAAKVVYKSYKLPQGPDILSIEGLNLTGLGDGGMWNAVVEASDEELTRWESQNIASVKAYVDVFPADAGAVGMSMTASDGAFDAKTESASIAIDTSLWSDGRHIVYFQAMDGDGYEGPVSAIFVDKVSPLTFGFPTAGPTAGPSEEDVGEGRPIAIPVVGEIGREEAPLEGEVEEGPIAILIDGGAAGSVGSTTAGLAGPSGENPTEDEDESEGEPRPISTTEEADRPEIMGNIFTVDPDFTATNASSSNRIQIQSATGVASSAGDFNSAWSSISVLFAIGLGTLAFLR